MAIPLLLMGFVAASLTTGAQSTGLRPRPCPGGKPFIETLEVSSNGVDCTGFPCALFKGKDTILTATFHTDKAMDDTPPSVRGTVGGIPVPWAVPAAEGYPKVVAIAGGYSYTIKFPVSSVYPSVRSTVSWDGRDSNGESIYCFKMPVILRNP